MKIQSRTSCFIIAVLLIFSVAVNAQTGDKNENVRESFSTQLKKGTVPGLKFAPVTTMLQPDKEDHKKEPENTIRNVMKGKGDNLRTTPVSGGNTVSSQPDKNQSPLASDKKEELKKEEPKAVKPVVPTQENAQENSKKEQ